MMTHPYMHVLKEDKKSLSNQLEFTTGQRRIHLKIHIGIKKKKSKLMKTFIYAGGTGNTELKSLA